MSTVTKRKPRDQSAKYTRPRKPQTTSHSDNAPRRTPRQNLTLADWLTVYAFIDSHPDVSQSEVVRHFSTLKTGALVFEQSTLSRKLRDRAKMEARVNDNPSALSSKRPRIVTRPDVERALVLWMRHVEGEGQTVSGLMLREKRKQFEDEFEVPECERLFGEGWLHSFCKTYRAHEQPGRREIDAVEQAIGVDDNIPTSQASLSPSTAQISGGAECCIGVATKEIADQVRQEIAITCRDGTAVTGGDDHAVVDKLAPSLSRTDVIHLCQQLASACMQYGGDTQLSLELFQQLNRYCAALHQEELRDSEARQTTLDEYFSVS